MTSPEQLETYYTEWLEIPASRLPPNHYALLGIEDFETDTDTIESAAKARAAYLHQIASGPNRKAVQEMLGQVAIARRCLTDAGSRSEYDRALRQPSPQSEPATPTSGPVAAAAVVAPASTASESKTEPASASPV
ncbi:MAG: hypothetical protein AAFX06_28555, partial [Planctomycetota bacterium]